MQPQEVTFKADRATEERLRALVLPNLTAMFELLPSVPPPGTKPEKTSTAASIIPGLTFKIPSLSEFAAFAPRDRSLECPLIVRGQIRPVLAVGSPV